MVTMSVFVTLVMICCLSTTKVIRHFIIRNDPTISVFKLKTVDGNEIIATEDHKFMVMENGIQMWKEVKDMVSVEMNRWIDKTVDLYCKEKKITTSLVEFMKGGIV